MKIGIDISQTTYDSTGVSNYLLNLIEHLLKIDKENEYILFFSSMRSNIKHQILKIKDANKNVRIKTFKFPQVLLDFLWNRLHVLSIERIIGDVDIFISSDWLEPPTTKAKKATILYDLIIHKYPKETDSRIVNVQKRKLSWVKKECELIICISESTKKDAMKILGVEEKRLKVIYSGI